MPRGCRWPSERPRWREGSRDDSVRGCAPGVRSLRPRRPQDPPGCGAAGTVPTTFFLDGRTRRLTPEAPADPATVAYEVGKNPDAASFLVRFETATELVGYPTAHLFVEAVDADDMNLFVLIQKLDAFGTPLEQFTVPNQSAMAHDLTDHGATILKYKGSDGRLRVSARDLDETATTEDVPVHSFDRVEKLSPGAVVEVDIELLPLGLSFAPGEQLRFIVSARNLLGTLMPGIVEYVPENRGTHIVHTGAERASYLRLPVRTR